MNILQRLAKVWDLLWSETMHVLKKFVNLVQSAWSFLIFLVFSLCFFMFGSSLQHNSSKLCRTSLRLCWLFAHICMVLRFAVFPIIPVGPFPNFINVVSIIMSNHIPFQTWQRHALVATINPEYLEVILT